MGPFTVGLLSDFFDPSFGVESLRYAMLAVLPTACVWSSIHFYLAIAFFKRRFGKKIKSKKINSLE